MHKRIPSQIIKQSNIAAAFCLLQRLWTHDASGIWRALSHPWPPLIAPLATAFRAQLQERTLLLVQRAYTDISAATLGECIGTSAGDAEEIARQRGWTVDASTGSIVPAAPPVETPVELNEGDLQKIAQYVVYLQHGQAPPPPTMMTTTTAVEME